jgi:hypothetical protein
MVVVMHWRAPKPNRRSVEIGLKEGMSRRSAQIQHNRDATDDWIWAIDNGILLLYPGVVLIFDI